MKIIIAPMIKSRLLLLVTLAGIALAGCKQAQPAGPDINALLADLKSPDPAKADAAYSGLFSLGEAAIAPLLGQVNDPTLFAGEAHQDPRYSYINVFPTAGQLSIYLVEAIRLRHPRPHETPLLVDEKTNEVDEDAFPRATDAYLKWWDALPAKNLEAIYKAPDPLAGTGLRWK